MDTCLNVWNLLQFDRDIQPAPNWVLLTSTPLLVQENVSPFVCKATLIETAVSHFDLFENLVWVGGSMS